MWRLVVGVALGGCTFAVDGVPTGNDDLAFASDLAGADFAAADLAVADLEPMQDLVPPADLTPAPPDLAGICRTGCGATCAPCCTDTCMTGDCHQSCGAAGCACQLTCNNTNSCTFSCATSSLCSASAGNTGDATLFCAPAGD